MRGCSGFGRAPAVFRRPPEDSWPGSRRTPGALQPPGPGHGVPGHAAVPCMLPGPAPGALGPVAVPPGRPGVREWPERGLDRARERPQAFFCVTARVGSSRPQFHGRWSWAWGSVGAAGRCGCRRGVCGRAAPPLPAASNCDGLHKTDLSRVGPRSGLQGPKNRANSGVWAMECGVLAGLAVGAGWVYCFLSRREGGQRKAG